MIKNMTEKYRKIIRLMHETRTPEALRMAKDAHALSADRIQNRGVGKDGEKFPLYSKNPMAYWKINENDYASKSKIENWKKRAAKEWQEAKRDKRPVNPDLTSYESLRIAYGLPVDKRTLTFTGQMYASIEQVVTNQTETVTEVTIRSSNERGKLLVAVNSKILGTNILSLDNREKEFIREMSKKRLIRTWNN